MKVCSSSNGSDLKAPSLKSVANLVLFCSLFVLSLGSTSALAAYQYTYTGNSFTTTENSVFILDEPPYVYTSTDTTEEHISVSFTSQSLLTTGAGFGDIFNFTISAVSAGGARQLPYPYPYPPDPGSDPGSPSNPNYDGIFNISAVDANGLPTGWTISVDYNYRPPTARLTQSFIQTATNQDITYGGYEGFYDYLGQLDSHPGTWSVTPVPEPETYAMLIAGLGLIGFLARRRKSHLV